MILVQLFMFSKAILRSAVQLEIGQFDEKIKVLVAVGLLVAAGDGGDDDKPDDKDKKYSVAISLHFSLWDNGSYLCLNTAVGLGMNLG